MSVLYHSWGGAWWVWYVVAAPLHASSMEQVGTAAGDDVAAAHVHGNAHHAMGGHPTTGRGDHCGDMSATGLWVKVGSPTRLPIQLSLGVVRVGRSAEERLLSSFQYMMMLKKTWHWWPQKYWWYSTYSCLHTQKPITNVIKIFGYAGVKLNIKLWESLGLN